MKILVSEYNGFCGGVKAAVIKADPNTQPGKKALLIWGNYSQQGCCGRLVQEGDGCS